MGHEKAVRRCAEAAFTDRCAVGFIDVVRARVVIEPELVVRSSTARPAEAASPRPRPDRS